MNIELLYTDTLTQAREKLKDETKNFELKVHRVACEEALGRICAKDVIAEENVPSFRRSTVDGYAILAGDSYGAGDSNPSFYQVTGCVNIEEQASMTVSTGEAVQVQTGSMIPDGATAVLMAEYTEQYADGKIIGYKAVSEDENIIQIGEDMAAGDCLIQRGREINARDIGMMAALGICDIEAYAPPAVTIISTGDELADIHEPLTGSKIRDINSYALAAEVRRAGMIVRRRFRVRDDEKEIFQAVSQSIKDSDIVLLSGGSSKGNKDYTKKVLVAPKGVAHSNSDATIRSTYTQIGTIPAAAAGNNADMWVGDYGIDDDTGAWWPATEGSGSSQGTGDRVYAGGSGATSGTREYLQGGSLWHGSNAGSAFLSCGFGLGLGRWYALSCD